MCVLLENSVKKKDTYKFIIFIYKKICSFKSDMLFLF
jgi:hypothetical protein